MRNGKGQKQKRAKYEEVKARRIALSCGIKHRW